MTEQHEVFELVKARGYLDDWTVAQFLCRQVVKLQEELAELSIKALPNLGAWRQYANFQQSAGALASARFDEPRERSIDYWRDSARRVSNVSRIMEIREELADMQVVLFCAAEAVSLMMEPFDVAEVALEKAKDDVERGVR